MLDGKEVYMMNLWAHYSFLHSSHTGIFVVTKRLAPPSSGLREGTRHLSLTASRIWTVSRLSPYISATRHSFKHIPSSSKRRRTEVSARDQRKSYTL